MLVSRRIIAALVVTIVACQSFAQRGHSQEMSLDEMANHMPANTNAIFVVNVEKIRNSAIAKKEGWNSTHEGAVNSGLIFLPENSHVVVMGAAMDYQAFEPRSTAAFVAMPKVPSVDSIQRNTSGHLDEIADVSVVETPADRYIAVLNENMVAAYSPAIRPDFTRWLVKVKHDQTIDVREYIQEGIGYAEELGTELILAFDLKYVVSHSRIYPKIKDNEAIAEHSLKAKDVSHLISSVRGFTLGVTVRDKLYGAVKIDFGDDISSLEPIAHDIAKGVFEATGFYLDEFDDWKFEFSGKQIKLSGDLTRESFRHILSAVDAGPNHATSAIAESGATDSSEASVVNKRYFQAVNSFIAEVTPKLSQGKSYAANANWLNTYAAKIDSLSTMDIEHGLVEYANSVADSLREAAVVLIEIREDSDQRIQQIIASGARSGGDRVYYRYGRYGRSRYSTGGDGTRLRTSVRQRAKSEAITHVTEIFNDIQNRRQEIGQAMTEKFGVSF